MRSFFSTHVVVKPQAHPVWTDRPFPHPVVGMRVRHYRGGEFVVVCLATDVERQRVLVVYRDANARTWALPESVFCGEVRAAPTTPTDDGNGGKGRVARFVPLDGPLDRTAASL